MPIVGVPLAFEFRWVVLNEEPLRRKRWRRLFFGCLRLRIGGRYGGVDRGLERALSRRLVFSLLPLQKLLFLHQGRAEGREAGIKTDGGSGNPHDPACVCAAVTGG